MFRRFIVLSYIVAFTHNIFSIVALQNSAVFLARPPSQEQMIHRYINLTKVLSEKKFFTKLNDTENLTVLRTVKNVRSTVGHMVDREEQSRRDGIKNKKCKPATTKLDLRQFNKIIYFDHIKKTIICDSGCTMEMITDFALSNSLIPKVLPEFRKITVGGAIVGAGLESSSFKYGQFNDICTSVYVLCGNGDIVYCTKNNEHKELFYSLAGSYGTLGTVLCAEIECIDTCAYVALNVTVFDQFNQSISYMNKMMSSNDIDFIEGIEFSNSEKINVNKTVIISGKLTNNMINKRDYFNPTDKHYEEFYFEKIQSIAMNNNDYYSRMLILPIKSFLFRYDRGAFWMAKPISFSWKLLFKSPLLVPAFIMTHNNIFCRFLFRHLFTTSILFRLLNLADTMIVNKRMVIMDIYVPLSKTESLVKFTRNNIPITTPLWLCPVLKSNSKQILSPHYIEFDEKKEKYLVDVGIYGRVDDNNGNLYTRLLDVWSLLNSCRKMLYSEHSYSKEEFWKYSNNDNNLEAIEAIREEISCN
eukprot:gene10981-14749_t